jgi:hypothetical protein
MLPSAAATISPARPPLTNCPPTKKPSRRSSPLSATAATGTSTWATSATFVMPSSVATDRPSSPRPPAKPAAGTASMAATSIPTNWHYPRCQGRFCLSPSPA